MLNKLKLENMTNNSSYFWEILVYQSDGVHTQEKKQFKSINAPWKSFKEQLD